MSKPCLLRSTHIRQAVVARKKVYQRHYQYTQRPRVDVEGMNMLASVCIARITSENLVVLLLLLQHLAQKSHYLTAN